MRKTEVSQFPFNVENRRRKPLSPAKPPPSPLAIVLAPLFYISPFFSAPPFLSLQYFSDPGAARADGDRTV